MKKNELFLHSFMKKRHISLPMFKLFIDSPMQEKNKPICQPHADTEAPTAHVEKYIVSLME
jgi:hypothetical protein